jgi:formylglycine-generating enzyme
VEAHAPATAPLPPLIAIPAQTFAMGHDGPGVIPADGESPARPATVAAFRIAPTTVTRTDFAAFVAATGHVTQAERRGSSFVFHACLDDPEAHPAPQPAPWWRDVAGANWRAPHGPGSEHAVPGDHPLTHVSWHDALAYCRWQGTRLPTEEEWEAAARGGLPDAPYPWGETPPDPNRCTIFDGPFPEPRQRPYTGTTPAHALPANGYGLHQTTGNVWEWCLRPAPDRRETRSDLRPIRGGSHLCHPSYCSRYRVSSRQITEATATTGHIGFRVAAG